MNLLNDHYIPGLELEYCKCKCGGIFRLYDRGRSNNCTCNECGTDIDLTELDYHTLLINTKTGWIFPMKLLGGE